MKRMRLLAAASRTSAEVSDRGPAALRLTQVAPPSVEYCQVPLVSSAPVIAMPRGATAGAYAGSFGSEMIPLPRNVGRSLPVLVASSSRIDGNGAVETFRTGAKLDPGWNRKR